MEKTNNYSFHLECKESDIVNALIKLIVEQNSETIAKALNEETVKASA